jgi:propanol-preferring alcohol dehydrogenase
MRAAVLIRQESPLEQRELPDPEPAPGQIALSVRACGVCRTDLHLRDGEIDAPRLPLVLGHQIVGLSDDGRRLGVPWLGWFTGRDIDGGYAERAVADERYCFALPDSLSDAQAAPLLCGGLIGYRALGLAGDAPRLGLYGFGSAAHIICQVAVHQGREVFAFVRPGDERSAEFARSLGAAWAGASTELPPEPLDAAIIFASDGTLVPQALRTLDRGGTVVCAGIHMSEIPAFSYDDLWQERSVRSVANLTRRDAEEFLALAPTVPVSTTVTTYPLEGAEQALADLRAGRFEGAAVILP